MHHDPLLLGTGYRVLNLAFQVLSIGDENEHLVATVGLDEHGEPPGESCSQRRARCRNDSRLDALQEQAHRIRIQGEGSQWVGVAFERKKPDPVAT